MYIFIIIILILFTFFHMYREKYDNYSKELKTCRNDNDNQASCINEINQNLLDTTYDGMEFSTTYNKFMPTIYPIVPKNRDGCKGIKQDWNNGSCNTQCNQFGYNYYRSDLNGCVNKTISSIGYEDNGNWIRCIPSYQACNDEKFRNNCKNVCPKFCIDKPPFAEYCPQAVKNKLCDSSNEIVQTLIKKYCAQSCNKCSNNTKPKIVLSTTDTNKQRKNLCTQKNSQDGSFDYTGNSVNQSVKLTNGFKTITSNLDECKQKCKEMNNCKTGLYVTGNPNNRKGECWLSKIKAYKPIACGTGCISFENVKNKSTLKCNNNSDCSVLGPVGQYQNGKWMCPGLNKNCKKYKRITRSCYKKLNNWCKKNRSSEYPYGRHLPGLANQNQSTPEWRCYSKESLTPDLMNFNNKSSKYWTSPELKSVWNTCSTNN